MSSLHWLSLVSLQGSRGWKMDWPVLIMVDSERPTVQKPFRRNREAADKKPEAVLPLDEIVEEVDPWVDWDSFDCD